MNNKKWLSETLSEKYKNQNTLHVGQTVSIGDSESGEGREHINKKRKGRIIGLYKNHFLVEFGKDNKYRESFNYIDIITSITNYADTNNRGGERLFSAKFGKEYEQIDIDMIPFEINVNKEKTRVKTQVKKLGKRKNYHEWTTTQIKYVLNHKAHVLRNDLRDDFNLKFGTNLTVDQINGCINREKNKAFK